MVDHLKKTETHSSQNSTPTSEERQSFIFFHFFADYVCSVLTQDNMSQQKVAFCFYVGRYTPDYKWLGVLHRHPIK
jgi:hypothetical protein